MIYQSSKKLSKCSKQELLLLLQAEVENRDKLIQLIDKEWDKWNRVIEDTQFPTFQGNERKSLLEGIEMIGNLVKNFYGTGD
ncbi:hypothetical protein [Enterococcus phoeniculicola]|uniref:Uncharacterized protein n=1 Tax=Enterococcus phoeniculicola ATCC BAA-412 TaxID=1158610 RepID=R3W2Y4_9ENTE|nr:hypothetical protein [Enterococcus phoeniculicola]EOL42017.1 hypothetical protein UC3_02365 [Enterococcus phoeniculicola ATCC BAA-412]EOT79704.1 hypothetical protein I589_01216 [Enterococcus phoeniculicola ATCC BAA-412]